MAIIEFGTEELDVALDDGDAAVAADLVIEPPLTPPAASPPMRTETMDERRVPGERSERLSGSWAAGLAIAWIAIFTIGVAFEPAPADPDAPLPLIATLLALGLLIGWIVMAIGLAKRARFGAAASLVAAVCLLGLTIGCPVSGHHSGLGAWWWFELVGSATLVALSGRALRSV
jgi:hypothetical protein